MFFGQSMLGDATFGSIFDDYAATINQYPSIGTVDGGTVYGSDGGSWWDTWGQSVINQGFGIGSQLISAFGRNPTQQVGAGGNPVGQGYSPSAILQAQAQNQAAIAAQQQALLNSRGGVTGGGVGSTVGGGVDGILSWATANPVPVFLGIGALFLLFREPPRSRR